jgi:hypothetical protein
MLTWWIKKERPILTLVVIIAGFFLVKFCSESWSTTSEAALNKPGRYVPFSTMMILDTATGMTFQQGQYPDGTYGWKMFHNSIN